MRWHLPNRILKAASSIPTLLHRTTAESGLLSPPFTLPFGCLLPPWPWRKRWRMCSVFAPQHRRNDAWKQESLLDYASQDMALLRLGQHMLCCFLIHFVTVVVLRNSFLLDAIQVFPEATVSREHLRRVVSSPSDRAGLTTEMGQCQQCAVPAETDSPELTVISLACTVGPHPGSWSWF